jgi:hypothetical protein
MKKLAVIESFEMAQHDYPPEFIAALLGIL